MMLMPRDKASLVQSRVTLPHQALSWLLGTRNMTHSVFTFHQNTICKFIQMNKYMYDSNYRICPSFPLIIKLHVEDIK